MDDIFSHLCQLLENIGFEGVRTHYPSSAEAMKGVVEVNGLGEPEVHDPRCCLLLELDKANAAEFAMDLDNEHGGLRHAPPSEVYLPESRMD